MLRYTVGLDSELVPYAERVRQRYAGWLAQQAQAGTTLSPLERWWLDRMVEVIAASAGISADDLDEAPSRNEAASTAPCATWVIGRRRSSTNSTRSSPRERDDAMADGASR